MSLSRRAWFTNEGDAAVVEQALEAQQLARLESELPTLIGSTQLVAVVVGVAAAATVPWSDAELVLRRADIAAWKAQTKERTALRASAILACRKRARKAGDEADQAERKAKELERQHQRARAKERNEQTTEASLMRTYQREDLTWAVEEHTIEFHAAKKQSKAITQ
jgi:hypothetical protein